MVFQNTVIFCYLREIFIKVVKFLHLKVQDFVMNFITFCNLIPPVLKQLGGGGGGGMGMLPMTLYVVLCLRCSLIFLLL